MHFLVKERIYLTAFFKHKMEAYFTIQNIGLTDWCAGLTVCQTSAVQKSKQFFQC